MDDQSLAQPSTPSSEPTPRRTFWHRLRSPLGALLPVTVMMALVVALVAGILVFASLRGPSGVAVSAQPTPTVPPNWRIYHAPNNAFSVAIPASWTASVQTSQVYGTYHGQSDDYTITMITLRGQDSITVDITMSPLSHAVDRQSTCEAEKHRYTNTKVAGLPALYLPQAGWLFTTSAENFQIGYFYPGYTGDTLQSSPPTPIPHAEYAEGQREINAIIASFRPNPDAPLKC